MKTLIPLTDTQIKLLIQCVDAESVHASTDQSREELNDVRRTLLNESGFDKQYSTLNEDSEYQSRHAFTPEYEEGAKDVVEQHTPMPPTYPQ